jgi:hypothetical protein
VLDRSRVLAALQAKRDAFDSFDLRSHADLRRYEDALAQLATMSAEEVAQRLRDVPRPGARPTLERVAGRSIVLPFEPRWANHQEARAWALRVLQDTPTLAVDGSQISPDPSFSIPVGAVQVGWFENPHNAQETYTKDIAFEVLAPDELSMGEAEGGFPDQCVNLRRFEGECQVLRAYMLRMAGLRPAPVCFFDGSLTLSFAAQMRPALQEAYLAAVRSLLDTSEETRVPLVGYVDTSYASDLVNMLRWLTGDTQPADLADAGLLRGRLRWGERTEAFVCARDDKLSANASPAQRYYERVHLLYLQTTAHNPPVRLELPAWLLEAGGLERVVDIVRAECVVGVGYPYAVETADALAVITVEDRERFYRAFQEFVASLGLELRYSRKAYSKRTRR